MPNVLFDLSRITLLLESLSFKALDVNKRATERSEESGDERGLDRAF